MSEVLDQHEIDALLDAVEAGDVDSTGAGDGEIQLFSRQRRAGDDVEIRDYDFKRPERISKDQIRALRTLHETFARNFGASLSGFLRTIVEVAVSDVEQMTYAEFIEGLPNPTSFNLVNPSPLDGQMCLEISPLIIYPIIDRLLGGSSHDLFIPQRPMTAIEQRLISQILERGLNALREAWEGVRTIDFAHEDMESNPQLVQIVPPNEVVVVIRFELKMSKRAGTMSLCIPFNVIEPIMQQLDAQSWFSSPRGRDRETWEHAISVGLHEAGLTLSTTLAETTMTVDDLRTLEVGDIITTSKEATEPVVVLIEGKPKYFARIGKHRGMRAIRVERRIRPGDRL